MSHVSHKARKVAIAGLAVGVAAALVTGCKATTQPPAGPGIDGTDTVAAQRLTALPASEKQAALATIGGLATKGRGPKTGYSRDQFGEAWTDDAGQVLWSENSCSSRDDLLVRDLDGAQKRDKCVVVAGTFTDPYTNTFQSFMKSDASKWPVDHVVPLSYAWQLGAAHWDSQKRVEFANDPLNLVVTTQSVNSAKSDSGPASYLPPNKAIRCAYVLRFAQVARKYQLAVTDADQQQMQNQCM